MTGKRKVFRAIAAAMAAAVPVLLWARSGGPDPGLSGVPREGACNQCHLGTALNGGPGSVSVEFPGALQYTPGVRQRLEVKVNDPAQSRFGFQLTARLEGDTGAQAGTLRATEDHTQVVCSARPFTSEAPPPCPANLPLQFIQHNARGNSRSSWEFDWIPPDTNVGPVTIFVAGNAANADFTIAGDRIYTRTYTLQPAAAAGAVPTIASAVNGASFQPVIGGGSWVSIIGANFTTGTTRTWRADEIVDGVLPTRLDGVSVTIDNKPAAVEFISPTQLNVLAQPDLTTGPVPVVVTNAAGTSATFTAQIQPLTPAFFVWNSRSVVATRTDFSLVGPPGLFPDVTTTPAKPGEVVILWGTGFGPTNPAVPLGRVVTGLHNLVTPPSVRIGGLPAEFLGGALTPQSAGLYQIVVRVPENAPDGELAAVAEFPGAASPSNVFLTVRR